MKERDLFTRKLLTCECKKSGCSEAEEDDLGHLEVFEAAAAAAPCEILLRSDFPSLFAGLISGWTSALKANDLIFKRLGELRDALQNSSGVVCTLGGSLPPKRTKS